jgi:hypothetical protein
VCWCLALALGGGAQAQRAAPRPQDDPGWLVKRYFVDKDFPDQADYLTGEMAAQDIGRTVGAMVPQGFRVTYRRLQLVGDRTVFAVLVTGMGQYTDSYVYLQRDSGGWKLAAVRTLTLPSQFKNALRVLRQQQSLADSVQQTFANMQLLAASDASLKRYFLEHRQAFETLVEAFVAQQVPGVAVSPAGRPMPGQSDGPVTRRLATLHLTSVYREPAIPGCAFLVVASLQSSAVGYIRAGAGCRVPAMAPDHFIYVEQIAPGWYLYKTS